MTYKIRHLALLLSAFVLALALYLFLRHQDDEIIPLSYEPKTLIYDIEKYPTWRDLASVMSHDAANGLYDGNNEIRLKNGTDYISIKPNPLHYSSSIHYYIHFSRNEYIFCQTDYALPHVREDDSSFFYTKDIQQSAWDELIHTKETLSNNNAQFTFSADDDFSLIHGWKHLITLFKDGKYHFHAFYKSKAEIIPEPSKLNN